MTMSVSKLWDRNMVNVGAQLRPLEGASSGVDESSIKARGNRPPCFQGPGVIWPFGVTVKVAGENVDAPIDPSLSTFV